MGIKQYSQEELKEMALVEIAHELFEEHKKPVPFQELLNEIASLLGVKKEELGDRIAQFYTDLNIDGRFLALSDQTWGLRSWYPYDQLDEETQPTVKAKKKKRRKQSKKILILTSLKRSTKTTLIWMKLRKNSILKPTILTKKILMKTTMILRSKKILLMKMMKTMMMKKRKLNSIRFHLQNDLDFHSRTR